MALAGASYAALRDGFAWDIPERFNIAAAVCDRHLGGRRTALIHEDAQGQAVAWTFEAVHEAACRLANVLAAHGVARGDRVGILLPQGPEALVAHCAVYRMGAVALPLFLLFGPEALEYRLGDSGALAVLTNAAGAEKIADLREALPRLRLVVSTDGVGDGVADWATLLQAAASTHTLVDTAADDPAMIIYTSGTTGNPKGALHAHRVLLGHMPGVEMPHDLFPQAGDRFWTPADWAWAGGLLDVLLPSLFHGVPVVAKRMAKFDPDEAFALMARHQVRNAFMPPTALKMMRQVVDPARHGFAMRSIGSGGERLGDEVLEWGRATFGLTINEFYGQTEANLLVANCASLMPTRPGSMGRAVPGHTVAVLGPDGREVPHGTAGMIAARGPDPVFFLRYWNNPEATAEKIRDGWLLTGDTGHRDEEGYFWFHARDDDVISSGSYRIGPGEIEECLMKHPAVAMVAVVGVPDALRGEVVKAFIVPREGVAPDATLEAEIQAYVKTRLSAHEYPRKIAFRTSLPMTVTGKIRRRDLREEG